MRKDIQYNADTQDIILTTQSDYAKGSFSWVEVENKQQEYLYGEITISDMTAEELLEDGVCVQIPYTPTNKPIKVRFKRKVASGYSYVTTIVSDNSQEQHTEEWFTVYKGESQQEAHACQLPIISLDFKYYFRISETAAIANVYAGVVSDFNCVYADYQNADMLLLCVPTNNYRYPTSGVGLVNWINANSQLKGLSERLKSEFTDDGVVLNDATYNTETYELKLSLNGSV
jgi:hypothetical protein